MTLDEGVTFRYAPPIANRDLLAMIDGTSQLVLNGCTLSSSTAGLRLTNGTVLVQRDSLLSADGIIDAQAISFGNGTPANDVSLQFLPAAQLEVLNGRVVYANT